MKPIVDTIAMPHNQLTRAHKPAYICVNGGEERDGEVGADSGFEIN